MLIGVVIILGQVLYVLLYPLSMEGVCMLRSDGSNLIVIDPCTWDALGWEGPGEYELHRLNTVSLCEPFVSGGPLLYIWLDGHHRWGTGYGKWPLNQTGLERVKRFIKKAKLGEKQEIVLRPGLDIVNSMNIVAVVFIMLGGYGIVKCRYL